MTSQCLKIQFEFSLVIAAQMRLFVIQFQTRYIVIKDLTPIYANSFNFSDFHGLEEEVMS